MDDEERWLESGPVPHIGSQLHRRLDSKVRSQDSGEEKEPSETLSWAPDSRLRMHQSSSPGPAFSLLTWTLQSSISEWVTQPASWCTPIPSLTFIFYFLFPYQLHLVHFKSKRYSRNAAYFSRIFELERIIKWLRTVNVECLELWVNYSVGHKRLLLAEAVFEVR